MKKIIVGVTGSIAAYKACDLVSKLTQQGYDVQVIMSQDAMKFITPLTLQVLSKNHVYSDVFQELNPHLVNHIALAQSADLIIIAPASANTISKVCYGLADDMLTCTILASEKIPLLIAPAMNTVMYENEVTQHNINTLKKRGFTFIEPKTSLLACGDYGKGALANIEDIIKVINELV